MKAILEWIFGPPLPPMDQRVPKKNPATLRGVKASPSQEMDEKSVRIFEPALIQYTDAYRYMDPVISDSMQFREWHQARMQALRHLLKLVQESRLQDQLILRGSMLMEMWFGENARAPGDIDWVFATHGAKKDDASAVAMFGDLKHLISTNPRVGRVEFQVDSMLVDDIWMYERAHGRRLIVKWKAEGLPPGEVQMDVAFGEEIYLTPAPVKLQDGPGTLLAVSKELSLAWKLSWLISDQYPQGKDLFDATLLAENTVLTYALFEKVINASGEHAAKNQIPNFPMELDIDWPNFIAEYPWVEGDVEEWKKRLTKALEPMFSQRG